jgi:hypothetical protein
MTDDAAREAAEHNAVAWLVMTDEELIRCSASLGLPAELHPNPNELGAKAAEPEHLVQARKAADDFAREHAGAKFVKDWIKENR